MNQESFNRGGEPRWRAFEVQLLRLEKTSSKVDRSFPRHYRGICHDLALARQRHFDAHLIDRLNGLALRGHQHLHQATARPGHRIIDFWVSGLPAAIRREAPFVWTAAVLFYGSGLLLSLLVQWNPDLIHSVLGPAELSMFEEMYDPGSAHHLHPREHDSDAAAFGFYINNNMSVGFRTFAGGVFAGIGSLFFLLINGVLFGALVGHVINIGFGETFFGFVIGHGAVELQAVVLAAAAGLRLGWPLIAPGQLTRSDALRISAQRSVPLIYGATGMFLVAAGIEAFWSASSVVPFNVKIGVGAMLWVAIALYFFWTPRSHGS